MNKTYFSTPYRGYTITYVQGRYQIAGMPSVHFLSIESAKRFIDKLEGE
jgi:hypothetical protein